MRDDRGRINVDDTEAVTAVPTRNEVIQASSVLTKYIQGVNNPSA